MLIGFHVYLQADVAAWKLDHNSKNEPTCNFEIKVLLLLQQLTKNWKCFNLAH